MNDFILDADSDPFHLPGTKIYRDEYGMLFYECPHCGRHAVPRYREAGLRRYAVPEPKSDVVR